mmetsp:Transcript_17600/g.36980  ORF Transcript_17600/g.36980 Transcript_17600/m.36980 type:complete len:484 (-) Transcript_17600:240-1691(-)
MMASMRYVRGEAESNHKKVDPSPSFGERDNKWLSSDRIAKNIWEGRGRGRGCARSSVNPSGPCGRGGGRGRGRFSTNTFVRESVGSLKRDLRPTSNSNLSDIRGAGGGSKKWVRKTDEQLSEIEKSGDTVTVSEKIGPMQDKLVSSENSVSTCEEFQAKVIDESQKNVLEKRGRNKLVLKHESSDVDQSLSRSMPLQQDTGFSETTAVDVDHDAYSFNRTAHNMNGYGQRAPSFKHVQKANTNPVKNLTWKRKYSELLPQSSAGEADNRLIQRNEGKRNNRKVIGARRILLVHDVPKTDVEENRGTEQESSVDEPDKLKSEVAVEKSAQEGAPKQKTFTDFCYRDTGRGRGGRVRGPLRGRGNFRGGRVSGGRSMGLVRVKPENLATMPICPTFRRGVPCNNPKCTLRHDVSSEASRPICVFFQRNGMCSKGDQCPFRHVKVRWDAEICPTFQRLGYCEDADCVLRHVTTTKKLRPDSSSSPA